MTGEWKKPRQSGPICGLHHILSEMEALLTKNQKEKDRLTWYLVRFYSDSDKSWRDARMASLLKIRGILRKVRASLHLSWTCESLMNLSKRHVIAKIRSAKQALDNFWKAVNKHFIRKAGKTLKQFEQKKVRYRDVMRTPACSDPQTCFRKGQDKGRRTDEVDVALAVAEFEQRTQKTIEEPLPTVIRHDVRTRGSSACALQAENLAARPAAVDNNIDAVAPNLTVKRKAFNTFATLSGKSVADTLPG
ncbi:MAG: hypothetical protein Q9173_004880 [Seirophora scorigena]